MAKDSSKPSPPGAKDGAKPAVPGAKDPAKPAVNKDYCFRHALMYEGYECPRCADSKGPASHGPSHSMGTRAPGGHAAPAPEDPAAAAVAQRSRTAAVARATEAQHLLGAGAARDAAEMAERSIELDPTLVDGYIVAARACQRLGETRRQEEFIEEASRLLRGPEYRGSLKAFVDLLKCTNDVLMVRPIIATFTAAGPWSSADTTSMIRLLVARGFAGEALRVIESVPVHDRTLAMAAHSARLTNRPFAVNDPEVDAHLSRIPASDRRRVLEEYEDVNHDGVLPLTTVMLVRDAVRARYIQWHREIRDLLEKQARERATEFLRPEAAKPAVSTGLRTAAASSGVLMTLALLVGGVPLMLVGAVLGVAAGGVGFVYRRESEISRRLPELVPTFMEKLAAEEEALWRAITSEDEPAGRHVEDHQPSSAMPPDEATSPTA